MEIGTKISMGALQITGEMIARPGAVPPSTAQSAAREFEAVFLSQAVEEMLKSVDTGPFGAGHAEETWRSFLARAYADQLAGQGLSGVTQSVEATIRAYQGAEEAGK